MRRELVRDMLRVENQNNSKTPIAKIGNYFFTKNDFVIFYETKSHYLGK